MSTPAFNNDGTAYTEAVLNRSSQDPGQSFAVASTPAQGNMRTAGGGESAQPSSSDMGNSKTALKSVHGSINTITDPEQISNGAANLAVASIPSEQQLGRVGSSGPNIGSNGQGLTAATWSSVIPASIIAETHQVVGVNYITFNGTTPVISLTNAPVAINFVSGASVTYPKSSVDSSGAGWSQSGAGLTFANGTYATFSAVPASKIPASGVNFYVNYSYNLTTTYPIATADRTGVGNDMQPVIVPNVANRFAR